jgi:N-hydroxyarylamine O-acetyltransferase
MGRDMRLDDYLQRIGVDGPLGADAETLRRLHVAHRQTFVFENLTIQRGGRISLALPDLERKFIDEGGGGYCFEHNTLFAAALRALGFGVTVLLGRVRRGPSEQWGRTHMVLRVAIAHDDAWLADVGFGGMSLIEPLPLRDGAVATQLGFDYTLHREGHLWVLAVRNPGVSMDLYEFSEDPQTAADIEIANHYTATHPSSPFRQTLTIQRVTPGERTILRAGVLVRHHDGRSSEEPVERGRLEEVARDVFGIEIGAGPFVFETYPSRQ